MPGFLRAYFFYFDVKRLAVYGDPVLFHSLSSRQRQRGLTDCSYGGRLHAALAGGNGGSGCWNDTPAAAIVARTAAADASSRGDKSDRKARRAFSSTAASSAPA